MDNYTPSGLKGLDPEFWNQLSKERQDAFNTVVDELSKQIEQSYDETLKEFKAALDAHAAAMQALAALKESERAEAISSLSANVTSWLSQRNQRCNKLGEKLGGVVRSAITKMVGI